MKTIISVKYQIKNSTQIKIEENIEAILCCFISFMTECLKIMIKYFKTKVIFIHS